MMPIVNLDFRDADLNERFIPRLEGFKFVDRDNRADKVELDFDNDDQALTEWYPPGLVVSFTWGYAGRLAQPRVMKIRKIKGAGTGSLRMEGFSKEFDLDRVQRTRAFENVTYVDVAVQIAQEHGYPLELINVPDQEELILPVYELINQTAETDAALLRRLAQDLPQFVFWMTEAQFYFNEPGHSKKPRRVLEYRQGNLLGNISGINSDVNLLHSPVKVTKKAHDPKAKKTKQASAGSQEEGAVLGPWEPGLFEKGQEVGELFDPKTGTHTKVYQKGNEIVYYQGGLPVLLDEVKSKDQEELGPTSETDQAGVQQEANQQIKKKKNARIKYTLNLDPGDPYLQAKEVIELRGASILSGPAYVQEVTHTIKAGSYSQEAKLIKGYLGKKPKKSTAAQEVDEAGGEVNPGGGSEQETFLYIDAASGYTHLGFIQSGEAGILPEAGSSGGT